MAVTPAGILIPDAAAGEVMRLLGRPASPLAGSAPPAPPPTPPVPAWMRLYPDTDRLLWHGNQLLARQAAFPSRSPLVHLLLEQLQLVIDFVVELDRKVDTALGGERYLVGDLTFTLDASLPVADGVRQYKFELEYPLRGRVRVHEFLRYGEHRWRYFVEVRGSAYDVREVSDLVDQFAGEERKFSNGRRVRVVCEQHPRHLDL